jgi:hypothetical protein
MGAISPFYLNELALQASPPLVRPQADRAHRPSRKLERTPIRAAGPSRRFFGAAQLER